MNIYFDFAVDSRRGRESQESDYKTVREGRQSVLLQC